MGSWVLFFSLAGGCVYTGVFIFVVFCTGIIQFGFGSVAPIVCGEEGRRMLMKVDKFVVLMIILGLTFVGCGGPRQRQVLVASTPVGAVVKIQGAEVGHTPVSLTFEGDTSITIEQNGYEPQEALINAKTGPNLVVNLVRIEVPEAQEVGYTTMSQIKTAYNDGTISRQQYDQYKAQIRARRAVELEGAKRDLRNGRVTEGKYKARVRAIKAKYEG
jgi:hypothetical protein